MNPALIPNMPFKGADDFTPIALVANVVNTMVINPSVPAKNLQEFIAYAKANPGKVAYASAGGGSTNHLSAEMAMLKLCWSCPPCPSLARTVIALLPICVLSGVHAMTPVTASMVMLDGPETSV